MSLPLVYALLAWQQPTSPAAAPARPARAGRPPPGPAVVPGAAPDAPNGDRPYGQVTWKSSRPGVGGGKSVGRLTARNAGPGVGTAPAGKTRASWTVEVTPN